MPGHQEASVVADIKETVAPSISAPLPSFTLTVTLVEPAGAEYIAMSFNGKSKTNPPTKQEIEIAKAVITRAGELGVLGDYKKRAVKKLDKDKMKFDYDKEESEFEEEL